MGREGRFAGAIVIWVLALCVLAGWDEFRTPTATTPAHSATVAMLAAP